MMRLLLLLHRYLGIAVGVLMVMWCLSGVVMMYVSYPTLDQASRLSRLAPLVWNGCCKFSAEVLGDADPVGDFSIEMLAGRPFLEVRDPAESAGLFDLISGASIERVSSEQALTVVDAYAKALPQTAPRLLDTIAYDQWTVAGGFNSGGPLYHFSLGDRSGTELYVSSISGRVVQVTTARMRFWSWLGSVPHWLYFAELRRRVSLWSTIVILTSLVGCFLALTGLYIGVRQLLHRPAGRWSPYRGFNLWHHVAGLVFGVFTLSWVLSGLLSVNPWGWLEGASSRPERARLQGSAISAAQLKAALRVLAAAHPSDLVSLESAPLDGRLFFIATTATGGRARLGASGALAPLDSADVTYIAAALSGSSSVPTLMRRGDSYYFSHHSDLAALPVYRLISRDGSRTRYYIDPMSGMLVAKVDPADRGYRWWFDGLHRMDFAVVLRGRPQWDVLMLLLMSGVSTVCVTGAYLGYRRLMH